MPSPPTAITQDAQQNALPSGVRRQAAELHHCVILEDGANESQFTEDIEKWDMTVQLGEELTDVPDPDDVCSASAHGQDIVGAPQQLPTTTDDLTEPEELWEQTCGPYDGFGQVVLSTIPPITEEETEVRPPPPWNDWANLATTEPTVTTPGESDNDDDFRGGVGDLTEVEVSSTPSPSGGDWVPTTPNATSPEPPVDSTQVDCGYCGVYVNGEWFTTPPRSPDNVCSSRELEDAGSTTSEQPIDQFTRPASGRHPPRSSTRTPVLSDVEVIAMSMANRL